MTLPIWVLYLVVAFSLSVWGTAFMLAMILAYRDARWRRRQRRRERVKGYLPIFDDQWEPPR